MVLLDVGLQDIRDYVYDQIDYCQLGTDGTAVATTDTDLGTADANTDYALTAKSKSGNAIRFEYTLGSTNGTTTTYKEFKLYNNSGSINYTRDVMTGISFTTGGSEDIIITSRLFLRRAE
jgi:hypothetical protein